MVLIVDDHAAFARSVVSLLSTSGVDAEAVHSGAEALAFLRDRAGVALILLDMSMPDMSGIDVLRTMRDGGDGYAHVPPVLMFSADDYQTTREELIQLGAAGFVSKTDPAGLLRVVAAYTRRAEP